MIPAPPDQLLVQGRRLQHEFFTYRMIDIMDEGIESVCLSEMVSVGYRTLAGATDTQILMQFCDTRV